MSAAATPSARTPLPPVLWALMVGNFVIGTGVMVVPGTLTDISQSLGVSIPKAGQLITAAAILMGVGAPLFASLVAGWDRRRLLALSLVWYGLLTLACALAPSYPALLVLRVMAVVSPAIFTPQAAASVGLLVEPHQRGRAITFIFLGWSVASVMGMPLAAFIGGTLGWRWAFGLVGVLALASAWWVWRAMPDGVKPAALSRQAWGATLGSSALMMAVGVTLLSAFGQFTLFSYFAPYLLQTLGLSGGSLSLMFLWFGAFGLLGNVMLSRWIDRIGSARAVFIALGLIVQIGFLTHHLKLAEPVLLASSLIPTVNACEPGGRGYLNAINAFIEKAGALFRGIVDACPLDALGA